jgi:hypothetical protein
MAFLLTSFSIPDYDEWKRLFESDKLGRAQRVKRYTLLRGDEDANQVVELLEFDTVEGARDFRERLLGSGLLSGRVMHVNPTVLDLAERGEYPPGA